MQSQIASIPSERSVQTIRTILAMAGVLLAVVLLSGDAAHAQGTAKPATPSASHFQLRLIGDPHFPERTNLTRRFRKCYRCSAAILWISCCITLHTTAFILRFY